MNEEAELAALEADRKRDREEHIAWLARRPSWHDFGPKQATDPRKRRAMEETSRYLGESRDV